MPTKPKRILVLWWNRTPASQTRLTMLHHIHTLDESPVEHDIIYYNAFTPLPKWFKSIQFDAVILHYSFVAIRFAPDYWAKWKKTMDWIADWDCVKIAIPQDEYDKSQVLDEWLDEWGVSVVFSCFEGENVRIIYPIMSQKATFYYCFTGYIHEETGKDLTQKIKPLYERPVDIIYRARNLPFQFGHHGQLKHLIADIVADSAENLGLVVDISTKEEDTIFGKHWIDFMAGGKATIGIESGISSLDRRGETKRAMEKILVENPNATFEEVSQQMPDGWDSYEFFAISPRHFESVMTKTCQILVEGNYSGVLIADQHYIPLKSDFSNLEDALAKLKDDSYIQAMIDRAYEDIYLSGKYTYASFAQQISDAIDLELSRSKYEEKAKQAILWQIAVMYSKFIDGINYINAFLIFNVVVPLVRYIKKLLGAKQRRYFQAKLDSLRGKSKK